MANDDFKSNDNNKVSDFVDRLNQHISSSEAAFNFIELSEEEVISAHKAIDALDVSDSKKQTLRLIVDYRCKPKNPQNVLENLQESVLEGVLVDEVVKHVQDLDKFNQLQRDAKLDQLAQKLNALYSLATKPQAFDPIYLVRIRYQIFIALLKVLYSPVVNVKLKPMVVSALAGQRFFTQPRSRFSFGKTDIQSKFEKLQRLVNKNKLDHKNYGKLRNDAVSSLMEKEKRFTPRF